ncbi:unnamed protein product, partial [Effrenium voratum]
MRWCFNIQVVAAVLYMEKPHLEKRIVVGGTDVIERSWFLEKAVGQPGDRSRCVHLKGLMTQDVAQDVLAELKSRKYNTEPDSVDEMPTFEFYPMVNGEWADPGLGKRLGALVDAVVPLVRDSFSCSSCVAAEILVRRYVTGERRAHSLHFDGHAFATVVLGLTRPSEYDGGLYIQPQPHARSRRFVFLEPGDLFLHSFNLQHGVRLFSGSRYSLVLWIKPAAAIALRSTPWYDAAAKKGDPDAFFNLAEQYLQGTGGKTADPDRALELYAAAAELGHPFAANHLGLLLAESDAEESMKWLQAAAGSGLATAQKSLAFALASAQALAPAAKWMRRAAAQDDLEAAYVLGTMYLHGQGVAPDPRLARAWVLHSALGSYGDAMWELARWNRPNR